MNSTLIELYEKLPEQQKPLVKLVTHYMETLDKVVDDHRKLVAMNAIAGIKPDRIEELTYHNTISELKKLLISELVKTSEELEHLGDKNWSKHYKDGVL